MLDNWLLLNDLLKRSSSCLIIFRLFIILLFVKFIYFLKLHLPFFIRWILEIFYTSLFKNRLNQSIYFSLILLSLTLILFLHSHTILKLSILSNANLMIDVIIYLGYIILMLFRDFFRASYLAFPFIFISRWSCADCTLILKISLN